MAALPLISLAFSALSTGAQIGGGIAANRQSKEDASTLREIGRFEAGRARREGRRLSGRQRVAYAKAGVEPSLEVLANTAFETELNAQWALFASDRRADVIRRQGKAALISGLFGGATTILGGATEAHQAGLFASGSSPSGSARVPTDMGTPSSGWT